MTAADIAAHLTASNRATQVGCQEHTNTSGGRCEEQAIVIVWGKLCAPEQFGPKCREHLLKHFPNIDDRQIGMYAMFDLRPYLRLSEATEPEPSPALGDEALALVTNLEHTRSRTERVEYVTKFLANRDALT